MDKEMCVKYNRSVKNFKGGRIMQKIVVKARGSRIKIMSECLNVEAVKESLLKVGDFEIFFAARGKGKEIEKINDAIKETKELLKIARDTGINENYYSLSKQLKLLKEKKKELEKNPEDELDEVTAEFIYENGRLKVIYGEKIMEADDLYQELFLSASLSSLFVVIVK
jgi:hypothetical protein